MDDVVGIRVVDDKRGEFGVLSWGRVFGAVDENTLRDKVVAALEGMGVGAITAAEVCNDLGELQDFEYFYEGLISFSSQMSERAEILKKIECSPIAFQKSLYLLGNRRKRM